MMFGTKAGSDYLEELLNTAKKARENAYAPYSNFRVGAALLGSNGKIYTGCNVENASYGLTVCAERIAVFKAVSEGCTSFRALALVTDSPTPATPCGACRQVLAEFSPQLEVIMGNMAGKTERTTMEKLLPDSFALHKPERKRQNERCF